MSDDLLNKLLVSFQAEQRDHLEKIRGILDDLAKSGRGPGPQLEEAFRRAHSLKGAARAVDLRQIETLAHSVEAIFSRIREGRLRMEKTTLKTIYLVLDAIEDWVVAYFRKQALPETVKALDAAAALLGAEAVPHPAAHDALPAEPAPLAADALTVSAKSMEQVWEASGRVFVEMVGQGAVTRKLAQVESQILDLDTEWDRVKRTRGRTLEQLAHAPQFSPITRYLDIMDRHVRCLRKEVRDLRRIHSRGSWGLRQAGEHLREEVLQARMVPAENVFQGFRKIVRDLARDEGKEVGFTAEGLAVQADRLVLQALKDPLMHLLRNAVTHGLETPADRHGRGKQQAGSALLRLRAQGNLLMVTVADDGRGVDWKTVAEHAAKRRFLPQEEAESASPEALGRLLFLPGFSTCRMVTDLAGRGMGLSVVAETVKQFQGSVELRSRENAGTTIEIAVPIAVSTHRLLIVESAGQRFAIPAAALQCLVRVSIDQIKTVAGKSVVAVGDRPVPILSLAGLLGLGDAAVKVEGERVPVAVLNSPGGNAGLAVDSFVTEIEAVVKNLHGGAERVTAFGGAILTGDGAVVLVLDPGEIIERFRTAKGGAVVRAEKAPSPKRTPTILVVDDSVTTRTLEKGILEAHGYQVALAVDGEEALQKLRSESMDLAIVDLQMPRIDGFQLIEQMKKDPRLASLPVIIVSSLESREEKERGLALGADAYIIKRKFDHKGLLEAIGQIL